MSLSARLGLALLALLAALTPAVRAQGPVYDRPEPFIPVHPETREELNRREALALYGLAIFHERDNRLLAAVRAYEEVTRLDPEAAPAFKALVTLYLGLDRLDDALAACKKALDLDPGDYETWLLYARQLRVQDRSREAAAALGRALTCPKLKEHPDVHAQIAVDLALLQENLNDFAKAEAAYLEVIKVLDNPAALEEISDLKSQDIDARAAEIYERLGRVSLRADKPDKARDYFLKARDKVKEKDPARAKRLSYNLAELYLSREEWEPALAALDEYLETLPQGTEAYRAKIKALQKLGRGDEVMPILEKYAVRDAQNAALKLLYAEQLGIAGRFDDAERIFKNMAQTTATADVYRGLFKLYAQAKPTRFDRLVGLFDETLGKAAGTPDGTGDEESAVRARSMLVVMREDPALVRGLLPVVQEHLKSKPSLNSTTCFFFGILAARAQQLDAAEQMFRQCLRNNEGDAPRLVQKEPEVYQNLLRVLQLAHKNEAIVEVCREGLRSSKTVPPFFFHLHLAQALARLGKLADGLKEADAAVEAAPDPSRLLCRETRVRILMQAERYDQAASECKELLKQSSSNPEEVREIRHTLSIVYSAAHEYDKAEEQLRILLDADANDAMANNDLGYQWADQGKNLEEAEKLIRKAIDLDRKQRLTSTTLDADADRDNAAYIDSLGWVLFRRGKYEEARKEMEKAVALPDGAEDPTVWDHLGDVCARQGDRERARQAWSKAVELYEVAHERQLDERYKEIKQKLRK
jgi:tetratricopeptide (TPR) repeat protein